MKTIERQAWKCALSRIMGIEYLNMIKPKFMNCNNSVLRHKTNFPSVYMQIWRYILSLFKLQVRMSQNVTFLQTACMRQV